MNIEKRLERLEAILDARGLDWDHPRVEKEPAKESPKKWRILQVGEEVQEGDLVNCKLNLPSDPPDGLGWIPVIASVGASVCEDDLGIFARLVADEPPKPPEPEYREPVLPADAGKVCEFSDDGETWETEALFGFSFDGGKAPWESETRLWEHARIKKDA